MAEVHKYLLSSYNINWKLAHLTSFLIKLEPHQHPLPQEKQKK